MKNTRDDVAISEIIGFVLVLAIIIAALALYTAYVVPVNGREDEIRQMNYVEGQFTDYKLTLDALWTSRLINTNGPSPVLSVSPVISSSVMRLGNGGNSQQGSLSFPLFKPVASAATLSIKTTGDTFSIDSSSYHSSPDNKGEFPLNITVLEYRSNNYYWIQQQYSYQLGGVFLSQDNGIINRISPLISITNSNNKSIVVNVVPVQVFGNGSYTSNNLIRLDTRQRILPNYNISSPLLLNNQWVNFSITTADNATAVMWQNLFLGLAATEQIDPAAYTIGNVWNPVSKTATVFMKITGTSPDPLVSLYVQRAEFDIVFDNVASGIT
ncbi:MAG: hypothetical protein CVV30_01145 [Methanomicrobiales archaeon HGW-Methanomicrobiales-1]|jgi:hypothetical protein|nr:MAG: hypothetical protein CVV30_01145 [Methanomicrobiales archaeon HGW-Methanomicrobiales-1]